MTHLTIPASPSEHRGHGRRLADAIQSLDTFPVLAESRARLLEALTHEPADRGAVVAAIESDIALTIAVLRLAAQTVSTRGRAADSVVAAVDLLSRDGLLALADGARTFDFFEHATVWDELPDRLRRHAVATQRIAEVIARRRGIGERDRLMVTALLHDVGTLVLARAYPDHPEGVHGEARTPEARLRAERLALGVDHAMVGGVLARRWGLPRAVSMAIEQHHRDDAVGDAAIIRVSDMLAHYQEGAAIDPHALSSAAAAIGMDLDALRWFMYELPAAGGAAPAVRDVTPCPLSDRELSILRELGAGKVYKQIAATLGLSRSTVRSHLHNIYGKIGVADRAQAVLRATEHGWI